MKIRNPFVWLAIFWALAAAYASAEVPTDAMCEVFMSRSNTGGSGVIVGHSETKTFVLSCYHIMPASGAQVKFSNGERFTARLERPHGCTDDLLMYVTPRVNIESVAIATEIRVGDSVWKAGFPATAQRKSPLNIQRGTWTAPGRFDCYVWSGDSGGGVFNASGELLGIIEGFNVNTSMCSSLEVTQEFLSHWGKTLTQYCQPGMECYPQQGWQSVPQQQIEYGGYARPQYPSPSVPGSQPAPSPQPIEPPVTTDLGCACDLAELAEMKVGLAAIKIANEKNIQSIQSLKLEVASGVDGNDGQRGETGSQGPRGPAGQDGKPGSDADADKIIAAVLAKIPPFRLHQQSPYTGEMGEGVLVYPGDTVYLKAQFRAQDQEN